MGQRYIAEPLRIMQKHSINRKSIQWKNFRNAVMIQAGDDRTPDDSHQTLKYAIDLLGDGHSFFATQEQRKHYF